MATTKKDDIRNIDLTPTNSKPGIFNDHNLDDIINSEIYPDSVDNANNLNQMKSRAADKNSKSKSLQNYRIAFGKKTPSQAINDVNLAIYRSRDNGLRELNKISSCFSNVAPSDLSESEFLNLQALKEKFNNRLNLNPDITSSLNGISKETQNIKDLIETADNPQKIFSAVNQWALSYSAATERSMQESLKSILLKITTIYTNEPPTNFTTLNNLNALEKEFSFDFNINHTEISKGFDKQNESTPSTLQRPFSKLNNLNSLGKEFLPDFNVENIEFLENFDKQKQPAPSTLQRPFHNLLDKLTTATTLHKNKLNIKNYKKFTKQSQRLLNKFVHKIFKKSISIKRPKIPNKIIIREFNQRLKKNWSKNNSRNRSKEGKTL